MSTSKYYHQGFYAGYMDESMASAKAVIEVVLNHIQPPSSVVDVGCGIGTWLKVWQARGAEIRGLDGAYVKRDQLLIDAAQFTAMELSRPTPLGRRFDLAESLEVAEHLHERDADGFVEFLCGLAPVILFGAAIPHQGGDHHVNEQWPEYWAEKFARKGYVCVDVIRNEVRNRPDCAYYYAQNTFLYVHKDCLNQYPSLATAAAHTDIQALARVHPKKWIRQIEGVAKLEYLLVKLPGSIGNFVARALNKLRRLTIGA
ncbi:class I SAM-dependent methyltransferase [Methylomagnum sp.]